MPRTFEVEFPVRSYECDAYGHVHNVNYLRFMQEAAFAASANAGYGLAKYAEMGRTWFVRETQIQFKAPVRYGDSLRVRTWVADFRRVRSRRMYVLERVSDGAVAAEAQTDWVFLETEAERPTRIPEEMIAAFIPEGVNGTESEREKFPEPPPPPPGMFAYDRRVRWQDVDMAGHVNNAVYMQYFEEAGIAASTHFGWPMRRTVEMNMGIVARQHHLEYVGQARLDDDLRVETWVSNVQRSSAIRHYRLVRGDDGALICRGRTQWVWVDLQTGRPQRIPEVFFVDFEGHIVL